MIQIPVVAPITNVGVADGQAFFVVPEAYNGYRIAKVQADVAKAGAGTGDTTIQIAKATGAGTTPTCCRRLQPSPKVRFRMETRR